MGRLCALQINGKDKIMTLVENALMAEVKNFGTPDEVREFPKGRLELIKIGGATIGRGVFEPGWRWATSVQPLAKTQSCEAPHFQYHVSGILRVKMDDGSEFDCKPGA